MDRLEREVVRTLGILGAVDPVKSRKPTMGEAKEAQGAATALARRASAAFRLVDGEQGEGQFEYAKIVVVYLVKMLNKESLRAR